MNKKDRIAISITIIWLFIFVILSNGEVFTTINQKGTFIAFGPIIAYWIFRFIKNDISFFSNKKNNNE